jgi:pimeloyl-ACP methyl ester carboxylesterase
MTRTLFLLAALLMASSTTHAQTAPTPPAQTATYVKPMPPGELIDIGGRRLHIECRGKTNGPVVIVEAGLSQFTAHSSYGRLFEHVVPFARICIYDRAGLGWSDPAPDPRTHQDMVQDLHKLIQAKAMRGPYILVGHSIGGLLVRLFTSQYPSEVAGVVLVDASPESEIFAPGNAEARRDLINRITEGLKNAQPGIPMVPMSAGTAPDVMMAFTPEIFQTVKQEYQAIDLVPASMQRENGYGFLGNRPLAVIYRGRMANPSTADDQRWREAQEKFTTLSSRSHLFIAEQSGHAIPYEQPTIVAEAIQWVLQQLK